MGSFIRAGRVLLALASAFLLVGAVTASPASAGVCAFASSQAGMNRALSGVGFAGASTAAPLVTFQGPPKDSRLRDSVNLGVSTAPGWGVIEVQFELEGVLVFTELVGTTEWCADIDLRSKPHGAHVTITVRAVPQGGSPVEAGSTYFIDRQATAAFASPTPAESGWVTSGTPLIAFTTESDVVARECRTTRASVAGPWTACTSPYAPSTAADGDYTVEVRVTDDLANHGIITRHFGVDRHPPVVKITTPADGSYLNSGFTPAFDADGGVATCALDGPDFGPCKPIALLTDGSHTVRVKSRDAAGHESTIASSRFTVDATPPAVAVTAGPPQSAILAEPVAGFRFTATDANPLGRSCRLDLGAPGSCDGPDHQTYRELADGPHMFTLEATDAAGNRTEVTRGFTVNAVKPSVRITSGPEDGATLAQKTISFGFASAGAVELMCSLDSVTTFQPCSEASAHTLTGLGEGQHVFRVQARDESDDSAIAARTFGVDTSAPDTLIDAGPADGSRTAADKVTFAFHSTAPGSSFRCRWRASAAFGSCGGAGATYHAERLAPGTYLFEVQAINPLGTPDPTPARRRFTLVAPSPPFRVANLWAVWEHRTRVRDLTVKRLPARARVTVSCLGRGCPFTRKTGRVSHGSANVTRYFRNADLKPRSRVQLRVALPDADARAVRFTIRRGRQPKRVDLCVPSGARRPKAC